MQGARGLAVLAMVLCVPAMAAAQPVVSSDGRTAARAPVAVRAAGPVRGTADAWRARGPSAPVQAARTGPELMGFGGLQFGDGLTGVQGGLSALWPLADLPIGIRGDGTVSLFSEGGDLLVLLGAVANVHWVIPVEDATVRPYIFGGPGLFVATTGDNSGSDIELQLGGGASFTPRLLGEARLVGIGGSTLISLLVGLRF